MATKLLDRVREGIRARHYSRRTEEAYVSWIRRFIVFHDKRRPADLGETIQELRGHRDVSTTMIYRHVLNQGGRGVQSPLDRL
jgi:integrase